MPHDPELLARGNVWLVRLDPTQGYEQAKTRPAVIVSSSALNTGVRALVGVAPISGNTEPHPLSVVVGPPDGGLTKPSAVLCGQVRAVDKARLIRHMGILSPSSMYIVDTRLRVFFNL